MEGFSVPFTVVRCKIRKPTWETGSWVSGVASWPTARLSEMMKSPCSHWNHKQTPRSFQCLLIYTFLLKVIVVRDCQNHGSWCYIFRIHKFFISILIQGKTNYLAYVHNLLILSALQYPVHKTLSCVHDLFSCKHNIILHKIGSMK